LSVALSKLMGFFCLRGKKTKDVPRSNKANYKLTVKKTVKEKGVTVQRGTKSPEAGGLSFGEKGLPSSGRRECTA